MIHFINREAETAGTPVKTGAFPDYDRENAKFKQNVLFKNCYFSSKQVFAVRTADDETAKRWKPEGLSRQTKHFP